MANITVWNSTLLFKRWHYNYIKGLWTYPTDFSYSIATSQLQYFLIKHKHKEMYTIILRIETTTFKVSYICFFMAATNRQVVEVVGKSVLMAVEKYLFTYIRHNSAYLLSEQSDSMGHTHCLTFCDHSSPRVHSLTWPSSSPSAPREQCTKRWQ